MKHPSRGEIWEADLNPTRGHEQAGRRPVLIISTATERLGKGAWGSVSAQTMAQVEYRLRALLEL